MMDPVSTLIANSDDVDELLEFMLYDFLHEPSLNASINLTIEDAEQCYQDVIQHCVASGVSSVQRNSNGKIVGFNLSAIVNHGEEEEWKSPTRIQLILDLLDALNDNVRNGPSSLMTSKSSSTSRSSRTMSVTNGGDLHRNDLSYEKARKMGAKGAFAECTSAPSQTLFAKTGYRVLREIQLNEFIGNDGEPVFVCPDGTTTAQLVFKMI